VDYLKIGGGNNFHHALLKKNLISKAKEIQTYDKETKEETT